MKSLSRVRLFATPWTVALWAPLSMGFSRQEYWSGLPFPSPGDLPNPGIEPRSPALQADALILVIHHNLDLVLYFRDAFLFIDNYALLPVSHLILAATDVNSFTCASIYLPSTALPPVKKPATNTDSARVEWSEHSQGPPTGSLRDGGSCSLLLDRHFRYTLYTKVR